ncbi:GDSL esterase/lipase At4g10955 [Cajanus cajan]|uniref:GDSL esterase/lipase At4g10955 family n=1 Tax=Cajanus cajan TaxID=3821 RepID=A0A151SBW8_CAJCA|nr:GDSL esterase/lipase At4g10955 [Cajanus cajan]KYP52251.1 GDSL esterase/lipase At4g10955 family [Cajanus cajan]
MSTQITSPVMKEEEEKEEGTNEVVQEEEEEASHPYAFHVSGPRNLTTLNWRDLISSSWKDANYKRTVIACFIQAVYLLELDRQENRSQESALAPNWWIPFKYKLTQTLIDERDGSIFGAILEWDRSAAMADLVLIRPSGAPKAVLALRGTLLKSPTMRRDIEDDLRFLAWESLKGSVRFKVALEVLKSVSEMYGSSSVCVAGHSLGAGFALQVGKALAKEGIYVETHLFNPPSVSLAMSLRNIGEKAELVWKRLKSMLPSSQEAQVGNDGDKNLSLGLKSWIPRLSSFKNAGFGVGKWVPHLYVNNSDYICCSYTDSECSGDKNDDADKENVGPTNGQIAAKLFVVTKEKQKFHEAHGLEQWWSSDAQLQQAIHSKLISRQLKSLYTTGGTSSQVMQGKPPR